MPYKGTKKKAPKPPKAKKALPIESDLYDRLESMAFSMGLVNPRNGDGNRSELIRQAVDSYRLFSRTYPDSLPYPQELIYLLLELDRAIDSQDSEKLKLLRSRIQPNIDYLESWGTEVDMKEAIDEGVIKVGDSWIA